MRERQKILKQQFYPAVVAEWSKALSQIQVGSDPAWGMYLYGTVMDPLLKWSMPTTRKYI